MIYTSVLGRMVLSYPQYWAMPIAIAIAVVFLAVVGVGLWSGRVTIAGTGIGVVTWLIAVVSSIFLAQAFWIVLRDIMIGLGLVWMQFDVLIMTMCSIVAAAGTLAVERRRSTGTIARRAGRPGRSGLVGAAGGRPAWWLPQLELCVRLADAVHLDRPGLDDALQNADRRRLAS